MDLSSHLFPEGIAIEGLTKVAEGAAREERIRARVHAGETTNEALNVRPETERQTGGNHE
jgi:hypothetical protein